MKLSAVIITRNEANQTYRCIKHINPYVDEVVVVDMESSDETVKKAREFTNRIYKHQFVYFVEPVRNFAIEKARYEWVLVLDPDEVIPESLGLQLRKLIEGEYVYYRLPRKNIILGRWMQYSGWWPDYQLRLFKKGFVTWKNEIHSIPYTEGKGADLDAHVENALIHHHYTSVSEYLEKLNRYTTQEAQEKFNQEILFSWVSLIHKPASEFFRRYFVWEGYRDGLHGLVLSTLQAFSMYIVEIKLWELQKYTDTLSPSDYLHQGFPLLREVYQEFQYWFHTVKKNQTSGIERTIHKIRAKIRI